MLDSTRKTEHGPYERDAHPWKVRALEIANPTPNTWHCEPSDRPLRNPNHRRRPRVRAAVRVKNEPDCDLSTVQLERTNEQHPQTKQESVIPPQCGALTTPQPSAHSHRPIPVLLPASSWRAGFLATPARSRCPPSPTQSLPLKPTPPSRSKNTRSRRLAHGASTIVDGPHAVQQHNLLCHLSVPASAPCPSSCFDETHVV